jgi:hypothetical protein
MIVSSTRKQSIDAQTFFVNLFFIIIFYLKRYSLFYL